MKVTFRPGYAIYRTRSDPVIVTPHSGPALEVSTTKDEYSETVGSYLWRNMGGTFIISNATRNRALGIDFNRGLPPKKQSLSMFQKFLSSTDTADLVAFQQKYGFAAGSEEDYESRKKIYENFWKDVSKGKMIVMLHRSFPRLKALPSIMDITLLGAKKSIKPQVLKNAVEHINKRYEGFFADVKHEFNHIVMMEQQRLVASLVSAKGSFMLNDEKSEQMIDLKKDYENIKRFASKKELKALDESFTAENFLEAAQSATTNSGIPRVTIENVFSGSLSKGPQQMIDKPEERIIIQVEPTAFLNYWYPNQAAMIIRDLLENIEQQTNFLGIDFSKV